MAEIVLNNSNFEETVMNSKIPVLVDFWAPWCGPCQMLGPVVKEIAEEYEGKLLVGKVNIDDEIELAQKFGVMSIPTLVCVDKGQVIEKAVGYRDKAAVLDLFKDKL